MSPIDAQRIAQRALHRLWRVASGSAPARVRRRWGRAVRRARQRATRVRWTLSVLARRYAALGLVGLAAAGVIALPPPAGPPPPDAVAEAAAALVTEAREGRDLPVAGAAQTVLDLVDRHGVTGLLVAMQCHDDVLATAMALAGGPADVACWTGTDLEHAFSMLAALAGRRHWLRTTGAVAPPVGDYTDAYRFGLRWTQPQTFDADGAVTGNLTLDTDTGLVEGRVFDASVPTTWAVEEVLENSGNVATNKALLVARAQHHVTAGTTGNIRLRLKEHDGSGVRMSWGEQYAMPGRPRTGIGEICIEPYSIGAGTFPRAEGVRVEDGDSEHMALFEITSTALFQGAQLHGGPIIGLMGSGGVGCSFYRFRGLEMRLAPSYVSAGNLANGLQGVNVGMVTQYLWDMAPEEYPYNIVIEQCDIHGRYPDTVRRGVWLNGKRIAVRHNRIWDIGHRGQDSQAIQTTAGNGPYLYEDNYLGCSNGETIMVGGGAFPTADEIPADGQIINNTFDWPEQWRTYVGTDGLTKANGTKNHLEWKYGRRWLTQGNRFRNYRGTGYVGQWYALAIKAAVEGDWAQKAWVETHDITIRGNVWEDCAAWMLVGRFNIEASQSLAAHRIEVSHNLVLPYLDGTLRAGVRQFQKQVGTAADGGAEEASFRDYSEHHNTVYGPYSPSSLPSMHYVSATSGASRLLRHETKGNVWAMPAVAHPNAYWHRENTSWTSALVSWQATTAEDSSHSHNVVTGASESALIPGDIRVASIAALGLDPATHTPTDISPLLTADEDGGAVGCDISLLTSALAGV